MPRERGNGHRVSFRNDENILRLDNRVASCRVQSTEYSSVCRGPFEGGHHYLYYLHHSWASDQATGREYSPTHQQKMGLKIYWTWPRPSEQDPVSPSVSPIRKFPLASYPYPSEGRQTENHNYRKLIKLIPWTTGLPSSMKLWAMLCRATQDGQVMVESSDKTWSTGEGNGKPLQYSCLENPMKIWKGKNIWHWKMNSPSQKKTIEWERLEISSRKLEIPREHFMQRWAR